MKNHSRFAMLAAVILLSSFVHACKPNNIDFFSSTTLVSLTITPSEASMAPGTGLQLHARGTFSDKTTRDMTGSVVWTSSGPGIASIDGNGLARSLESSSGTTTITATSGAVKASTDVTISPLVSITVTPQDATIAQGTAQRFTAAGTLQNSATQDLSPSVTWSASGGAGVTVDSSGLATAPSATAGSAIISATFGLLTGSAVLTIADIISIGVTPFQANVTTGATQQFNATGNFSNLARQELTSFVTWSSSSPAFAIINNKGLAASIAPGPAVITAFFRGVSGSALMNVTGPELASISITVDRQSLPAGSSSQLSAVARFSDGSTQVITEAVTWSSSNSEVATVSNQPGTKGVIEALTEGSTVISASLSGVTSNRVTLTVTTARVSSLRIAPVNPRVGVGSTVQFTVVFVFSDGTTGPITNPIIWSSSIGAVAVIGPDGLATALTPGTTTITAVSGNSSASTVLTVTPF